MDIETEHYAVGPVESWNSDHTLLTVSGEYPNVADGATEGTLFVCLDCGLATTDRRWVLTSEVACDRAENDIPETLRERLGGLDDE
jgi:hypothetical protein